MICFHWGWRFDETFEQENTQMKLYSLLTHILSIHLKIIFHANVYFKFSSSVCLWSHPQFNPQFKCIIYLQLQYLHLLGFWSWSIFVVPPPNLSIFSCPGNFTPTRVAKTCQPVGANFSRPVLIFGQSTQKNLCHYV